MKKGTKTKLMKFNGKQKSNHKINDSENYWKLIGETGVVQQDPREKHIYAHFSKKPRVLVKFDRDLYSTFGFIAHNNIENSLWILVSDLKVIE